MQKQGAVEVLLVEDSPTDAELTLRALRKHGLAEGVFHVEDGAEALDFLFGRGRHKDRNVAEHPKVVLLDLKLPKVDGHEVLRQLKTDPRTRTIPVVILTSSREEEDLVRSYENGGNSYIVKPVEFEKFMNAVGHLGFYWMVVNQPAR